MKAIVNEEICIGCNLCVEICPEVFEMTDQMIARVILDPLSSEVLVCAQDAMESCPVSAITLE